MNRTTLRLEWLQSGYFSAASLPAPAYFALCVKPASQVMQCASPTGGYLPAASVPSTRWYNGFFLAGYRYTYDVQAGAIADSLLDVDATWSIAACRTASMSSCRFSPARPVWISSRELHAQNVQDVHGRDVAVFNFEVKNEGTTQVPPFMTHVAAWQVLLDANQRCRIDINAPDVRDAPGMIALLANGEAFWFADLPRDAGNMLTTPAPVVGMHRWSGGANVHADVQSSSPAPSMRTIRAAQLTFAVPNANRPRAYVGVMRADSGKAVREADENDNGRAECSVLHFDPG